jgi:DNA-binding HxlR family transcriptional regulator
VVPSYGEYCPIAAGAELFGDRWTPLVLRELILGCRGFNEIHRGLPRMSRSLLSQRLRELERRGIVSKTSNGPGRAVEYALTAAGRDLEPIVWSLGRWAAKWTFGDPADEELDVAWLAWRMHQFVIDDTVPDGRTVVELAMRGPGGGRSWVVLDRGGSTACITDPGYDVDLVVSGDNRAMHRWLLGLTPFRELVTDDLVRIDGPTRLARAFPRWFDTTMWAEPLSDARRRRSRQDTAAAV